MEALPNELCLHISGFLDLQTLTKLRAVSRRWNAAADAETQKHPRPNVNDAFRKAVRHGCIESVKYLVEVAGASVDLWGDDYLSCLAPRDTHLKIDTHLEIVKYLVASSAEVHARANSTLRWAAWVGRLDLVKDLIEVTADVHVWDDIALRWAARQGHLEIVKYLVETAGANVHAQEDDALYCAAWAGHLEIVKYLVEVGKADVHARNDDVVRVAACTGHLQVVEYLKAR